uniref:Uncharacterized protein n=1 Tax=Salvator merianae TaxID=96440 RepID=A0A8D0DZM9_SALMN
MLSLAPFVSFFSCADMSEYIQQRMMKCSTFKLMNNLWGSFFFSLKKITATYTFIHQIEIYSSHCISCPSHLLQHCAFKGGVQHEAMYKDT